MRQRILYTIFALLMSLQAFAQSTVSYEYDANNRLTKVTYGNGVVVTYTYDALGNRLTKKVTGGFTRGDVNGDGDVNASDIVELVCFLNGEPTSAYHPAAADVNGDGDVNGEDVDSIVNIIMQQE